MSDHLQAQIAAQLPPIRTHLLAGVLAFTRAACGIPGVARIALIGSLATEKPNPKDADLLVTIADDADLTVLAAQGRKQQGHAQTRNHGGEVFLANPQGDYIGRTCPWKTCAPGVRMRCDAQHCGWRPYLHDDLGTIKLRKALIAKPPIVLWPEVVAHVAVPKDVEALLLAPLRAQQARTTIAPRRIGKAAPRYRFLLNPFRDRRFAICPGCEQRTLLRKVPLLIHVDPLNPVAIHKSSRYCPACDLLIAHQDEIERELEALFSQRAPELIGNSYLVLGTLDRDVWKRSMAEPLAIQELTEHLHDFVETVELRRAEV